MSEPRYSTGEPAQDQPARPGGRLGDLPIWQIDMEFAVSGVDWRLEKGDLTPEYLINRIADNIRDAWRDAMQDRALGSLPCWPATLEALEGIPKHGACVYRIYGLDPCGEGDTELLYVGGTVSPRSRLKHHLTSKRFPFAQTIALEACVWSDAIAEIEARAIRWECPLENSDGVDSNEYKANGRW